MPEKEIMEQSCRQFMSLLSSKEPVPGGGGAAAFGGALGMGLANMVASLTVGKKKYAAFDEEMQQLLQQGLALQERLLALVKADAEAFAPLAAAYGLAAASEEEKAHKAIVLSEASKAATQVPLEIAEKTYQAMLLTRRIANIGSRLAISDAGCAILFLHAALGAARLNILINLPLITDDDFAEHVRERLQFILGEGASLVKETMSIVEEKL
ncbi:MAG: cyclodeaminase/cyclohydrolase family protein [Bacillota bacterium]|jgi:formiminotetrahydrofolate cyclodeaminase